MIVLLSGLISLEEAADSTALTPLFRRWRALGEHQLLKIGQNVAAWLELARADPVLCAMENGWAMAGPD